MLPRSCVLVGIGLTMIVDNPLIELAGWVRWGSWSASRSGCQPAAGGRGVDRGGAARPGRPLTRRRSAEGARPALPLRERCLVGREPRRRGRGGAAALGRARRAPVVARRRTTRRRGRARAGRAGGVVSPGGRAGAPPGRRASPRRRPRPQPVSDAVAGGAAGGTSAPVVVTLHNYRLLCLPATFLRDGRACEDCLGKLPWRGVAHRCYRDSAAGSAALAASLGLHRRAGHVRPCGRVPGRERVRLRDKHVEAGFDPGRIRVKPNFVAPLPRREGPGERLPVPRPALRGEGPRPAGRGVARRPRSSRGGRGRSGAGPARGGGAGDGRVPRCGAVRPRWASTSRGRARSSCRRSATRGRRARWSRPIAAGVPVVANRYGALPSVVADGVTGLLVERGRRRRAWRGRRSAAAGRRDVPGARRGCVRRLDHPLQSGAGTLPTWRRPTRRSRRAPGETRTLRAGRSWKEPEDGALDSVSQCEYPSRGRTEPRR